MQYSGIQRNNLFASQEQVNTFYQFDWASTPLGNPDTWSTGLKYAVQNMLHSSYPTFIWWGQELIVLHNNTYLPPFSSNGAASLGQPARSVWSAIWEELEPICNKVFSGHQILAPQLSFFSNANAAATALPFSFVPIFEEDGSVGGVLMTAFEVQKNNLTFYDEDAIDIQKLKESEARYRAFVAQSSEAIWRFELTKPIDISLPPDEQIEQFYKYGYLAECNDAMAQMYGYEKADDIIGAQLGDMVPASDQANLHYLQNFIAANYRLAEAESNEVDRDGQPRYFLNNLIGIIENGHLTRAWGTQRDITEQKKSEEFLRRNENQLRLMTNALPVLISYVDKDQHYRFVNQKYIEWFGVEYHQILNKHIREVLGEAAYNAVKPNVEKALSGQEIKIEQLLHYKNAGSKYVSVNYVPDIQPNGEIKGYYALVQDISDRKVAEDRYRGLFTAMQEGLLVAEIIDNDAEEKIDFRYLDMNPAAEKILGISRDQVVGRTAREIIPNVQEHLIQLYTQVVRTGIPVTHETYESLVNQYHQSFGFRPAPGQVAVLFWDITERKVAEEKVREREQELRTLANTIPQLAWMADPEGFIFWYNERWYEYTGTTFEQMQGWGWQSVHDPAVLPQVMEKWQNSIATGEPFDMEFPLRGADGIFRWFLTRIIPLRDTQGNILRWFGTNTDIDELRRMREAILESERQLQHLANAMPQVVWIANPAGTVNYYNNRVRELDGFEQVAPDQWKWQPMLHPDDELPTVLAWQKAVQEKSTYTYEHRLQMKDGSYRWHLSRAIPITDAAGNLLRWYGTATDIDDLKRAQEALAASQKRFQDLADTAPVLIWQAGLDRGCYYFNKGWLDFTGRTLAQEQGNGWMEGVHPDDFDQCLETYVTSFDKQEEFVIEYRLRHHDGTYRWLYNRGVPTHDQFGNFTGYLGGCIDIQEKMEAEEQKDAFIRIAGHELRTPLTSLLGYLNLIQKGPKDIETINVFLQKSYASTLKMRGLIHDFLYFANAQPGQFSYKVSTFNFDEMVAETVENFMLSYAQQRIVISGKSGKNIEADRSRIDQVISNLLNNAIKYSPEELQVEVLLSAKADKVILQVKDYGIGIEPDEKEKIFDRFYRAGNTGRIRGMGLGLFIVKRIVDYHKGDISVESEPGKGTTFTIELPAVIV